MELVCRCLPGELFQDIAQTERLNREPIPEFLEYFKSVEILILVDGNLPQEDELIANVLKNLQPHILLEHQKRIALVFSKFDHPKLQQYRNNIENFAEMLFPRTVNALDDLIEYKNCDVAYFACSAFGLLEEEGKLVPNVIYIGGKNYSHFGGIKDPQRWKPFGVVAPIYWLLKGEHDKRLLKI